ncbi:MAG: 30S ribosomal protein S9 [Rickettsia endosymbiont of Bryobia graminum]|nr:30S ribosomal protein S9 [Rickettsia endosymbiont of Bryobia graminum]
MTKLKIQSEKAKSEIAAPSKVIKNNTIRTYGTGRRKSAVARVWIESGQGITTVNKMSVDKYFSSEALSKSLLKPFVATKTSEQYNVICTVRGGGKSGQVGAIILGIARALDKMDPELHDTLHKGGFLTRDSRSVERKKFGKHKARKSTQFSKR